MIIVLFDLKLNNSSKFSFKLKYSFNDSQNLDNNDLLLFKLFASFTSLKPSFLSTLSLSSIIFFIASPFKGILMILIFFSFLTIFLETKIIIYIKNGIDNMPTGINLVILLLPL